MSNIKILPEILSNKIAAGEVVERPSSVVKELVENAIDAKSTKIIIEIEDGGKKLIRISDNGIGMSYDDALICVKRHATSKIYDDNDLFSINTLGFRGEALPSITSVSRFCLISKDKDSEMGVKIEVEGGKQNKVSQLGAPNGTLIEIKDLFFNVPARLKFLKTVNTEIAHISDTVSKIALSCPDIHIELYHNNKQIINWLNVSNYFDRILEVFGQNIKKDLIEIKAETNDFSVLGWITSPKITRRTAKKIYIYVNQRFIKDRAIQHALLEGYQNRLVKGEFPTIVLFLTIPFDQVDVNVHPTKNEVRFENQQVVYRLVRNAVLEAFAKQDQNLWIPRQTSQTTYNDLNHKLNYKSDYKSGYKSGFDKSFFVKEDSVKFNRDDYSAAPSKSQTFSIKQPSYDANQDISTNEYKIEHKKEIIENKQFVQDSFWQESKSFELKVIAQIYNTYILCESNKGLVVVDQHAAHERIIYEKLINDKTQSTQALVIPQIIEVGFKEADILAQILPDLVSFGIEIEPFGDSSYIIKAVPNILKDKDIKIIIIEIIEKIAEFGFDSNSVEKKYENIINQCLSVIACHSAIRANTHLDITQMQELVNKLGKCKEPSNCPHGRPTWITLDKNFFDKQFKRIL